MASTLRLLARGVLGSDKEDIVSYFYCCSTTLLKAGMKRLAKLTGGRGWTDWTWARWKLFPTSGRMDVNRKPGKGGKRSRPRMNMRSQ